MATLSFDVNLDDQCPSCDAAEAVAAEVQEWFPMVRVTIHRLEPGQPTPDTVIAVPAFLLEGRLIQFGTPSRTQISRALLDTLVARLEQSAT